MIKHVREELDSYRLYTVVGHILDFLRNLTNWYVRLNRPRMKGDNEISLEDQKASIMVLFDVLLNSTQVMAPVTPFLTEYIFQTMKTCIP